AAPAAPVSIVIVVVAAAAPPAATVAGLNEQLEWAGRPEQENETLPAKPPSAPIETVVDTEPPDDVEPAVWDRPTEKAGVAAAPTTRPTAPEVEPASPESPS